MLVSVSMTDFSQVHASAMRVDVHTVAQFLQETLGQRITAVACGLKDPKTIGRWARGEVPRSEEAERRLRDLFHVTRILLLHDTDRTARAWILGANPQLDDQSPLERLHAGDFRSVLEAARAFAAGG